MSDLIEIEQRESAFQNRLSTFRITNKGHKDLDAFFEDCFKYFEPMIESLLDVHYMIKVSTCLQAIFEKSVISDCGETKVTQTIFIHSNSEIVDFETFLASFYDEYIANYIKNRVTEIELRGSGFSLKEIVEIEMQACSYDPYNGATYIKTPKKLDSKKAIINVQNDDNQCFKYAILSAIKDIKKNPQRVSHYKRYDNELNFTDIKFPVGLKNLKKFEELNPMISINVYMWNEESEKVRPLRLTKNVKSTHIHLLLLTEVDKNNETPKSHYCWIKNLSALLSAQVSKNCRKKLFCDRCLNHFMHFEKLEEHKLACLNQNEYQIIMPKPGLDDTVTFEHYYKQLPVDFVVYADIESILRKPSDDDNSFKSEKTSAFQKHEVFSIGFYSTGAYADSRYRSYRGPDCVEWFVSEMESIAHTASEVLSNNEPMEMTNEEEVLFIWAEECHICGKPFFEETDKVRDHCHNSGAFRGAAHNTCNLNYQRAKYVTVVFHNLSNYDSHFIVKALAQKIAGDISIIPRNDEVYISFSKHVDGTRDARTGRGGVKLRFIDSFRFMSRSLDFLSSKLPSEQKRILKSEFCNISST
ncbi:uncharacterized protein LOC129572903 [Sitodiplosis mosellana]|uniref:uncharacterized protein LOC129572903 n=1 Tax=Sitodiplosis mosellana TaxID=263140 RepID=UPI0024441F70|nr:uncharacterized protein LOC129572903 [Sitodiplosis mosellana]